MNQHSHWSACIPARQVRISFKSADHARWRLTPAPGDRVEMYLCPEVAVSFDWGQPEGIGTAAYWIGQARSAEHCIVNRLGETLLEEVVACILGGHGVTAEKGIEAFHKLRDCGLLTQKESTSAGEIERVLREVGYRFARQRAFRVANAVQRFTGETPPSPASSLRAWLCTFDGVGPKTASWIVRNFLDCDEVAIIDIHILRAGLAAGIFDPAWRLPRNYAYFEAAFLAVASLGAVRASQLDAVIWSQMRRLGPGAGQFLPAVPTT